MSIFSRSELLIGMDAMNKLKNAHVAVFGVGGVGGYVCEMLVRSGVGKLSIFDSDAISESNRNRQIIALSSTTGLDKTSVMKKDSRISIPKRTSQRTAFFTPLKMRMNLTLASMTISPTASTLCRQK